MVTTSSGAKLRVAYFGTPAFAVPTLAALVAAGHDVRGVITQPDRPRGRGQRMSHAPVKAFAIERGLSVLQPDRLAREPFESAFAALESDLGVVAAYGKILPEWLLQAPRLGMINVHASLLPKYRGAAPVHRAVVAGEKETGVTIMRVVKALDAGPMLARVVRPIGLDDRSDEVEQHLAALGADLLVGLLDALAAQRVPEIPQNEADATYAPRLTKEEGRLDFARPAIEVHNQIRGLRPWPGAFTFFDGTRIALHRARLAEQPVHTQDPGSWLAGSDTLAVACGDGRAIDVLEIQPEGKRIMTAGDFLAGHGRGTRLRFG
jgi:methionyl-tRNA formyltransferase